MTEILNLFCSSFTRKPKMFGKIPARRVIFPKNVLTVQFFAIFPNVLRQHCYHATANLSWGCNLIQGSIHISQPTLNMRHIFIHKKCFDQCQFCYSFLLNKNVNILFSCLFFQVVPDSTSDNSNSVEFAFPQINAQKVNSYPWNYFSYLERKTKHIVVAILN